MQYDTSIDSGLKILLLTRNRYLSVRSIVTTIYEIYSKLMVKSRGAGYLSLI